MTQHRRLLATNLTTINSLLAGDSVTVAGSGAVADKNAAPNKAITNMGTLALAGTDAGNYNLLASGNKLSRNPCSTDGKGRRRHEELRPDTDY